MTKYLLSIIAFLSFTVYSQESRTLQFGNYKTEKNELTDVFVQIEIDSSRLEIGYYSSDKKNAELLKWHSYNVDFITNSSDNSMYSVFCGPFEFKFQQNKNGGLSGEKIYFDRVIQSYINPNKFKIDDSNDLKTTNSNPFLLIENPQFDFFLKNEVNNVNYSQYGVPITEIEVQGNNCKIENKFGSASISNFEDSLVTLALVNKTDGTIYYEKLFKIQESTEPLLVPKNYFDLEFDGGSITTKNSRQLLINKTNLLYIANWESVTKEFEIQIENAENLGYRNGILKVLPKKKGKVKIIITEKDTGYTIVSSEFAVV
jgi:hypothetical protein